MLAPLVLFASLHWPIAPPEAKPAGCQIIDSKVEGQPRFWLVDVYLQFPDGQQRGYLFSRREANERRKALLDCDDFMHHYEQHAKREEVKK